MPATGQNVERLADALRELGATLRGAPPDLAFRLDADTLEAGLNFTFATRRRPGRLRRADQARRRTSS